MAWGSGDLRPPGFLLRLPPTVTYRSWPPAVHSAATARAARAAQRRTTAWSRWRSANRSSKSASVHWGTPRLSFHPVIRRSSDVERGSLANRPASSWPTAWDSSRCKRITLESDSVDPLPLLLRLDGSMSAPARQEAVERFEGGEGALLLISLRAGGTGLNLTSADNVIHLDPWWNPAEEDQASDRVHRIGQRRPTGLRAKPAL